MVRKIRSKMPVATLAGGNCAIAARSLATEVVATATVSAFSAVNLLRTYRMGISAKVHLRNLSSARVPEAELLYVNCERTPCKLSGFYEDTVATICQHDVI